MNVSKVYDLLDKYWAAETTVQEEQWLKNYFNQDIIPEDLLYAKPMFTAIAKELSITSPDIKAPAGAKIVRMSIYKKWITVAAMYVVLAGSISILYNTQSHVSHKANYVEVDNADEALEYTMQALAMVSKSYRKGATQMKSGLENFEKVDFIK